MSKAKTRTVVIAGAGRIAWSVAPALVKAGYTLSAVISSSKQTAAPLAKKCGAPLSGNSFSLLKQKPDILILAVPDYAVAACANEFAEVFPNVKGMLALHLSGSLTVDALNVLSAGGASAASLHIMQIFSERKPFPINGIAAAVEAPSAAAAKQVNLLARGIGLIPVNIKKGKKAVYHLAGVFSSNFFIGNYYTAEGLLKEAGLNKKQIRQMLLPIILSTIANTLNSSPARALSGPVARGDAGTVARHLAALGGAPAKKQMLKNSYIAQSEVLLEMLQKAGMLKPLHAEIKKLLKAASVKR